MADVADSPENKTLDRLASELSLGERHNLLEKLQGQTTLSFEPLYELDEAQETEDFDARFSSLPWYYRLYYFILSLFKGKPPSKVFEDKQVAKMGRAIQSAAPDLYDCQRNHLLFNFFQPLVKLKDAARFFFDALDASISRDKGAFYAFLGSLEMGEVHSRLQNETDPVVIMEKFPGTPDSELRQLALRAMEDAFAAISEQQRGVMYYNARSLNCLKELSSFLFDRIILAFGVKSGGQSCPVNVVRDLLVNLNNILFSLKDPPTLSLLESLFVFALNDRTGEDGFDINQEMKLLLSGAENAIATIRDFNRRIPLTRILRCATRDTGLSPRQISGGEDWFQTYREYWRRKIESDISDYVQRRKYNEITNSFKAFLKGTSLKILVNVVSDSNRDGFPLPQAFPLSFLRTFHAAVFLPDLSPPLRTVLMEGEFSKKENRTEFTGAYNDIMNIERDIFTLDSGMAFSGDYGKRYTQAKQDLSALPLKRRKIQLLVDEVSQEAAAIVSRSRKALRVVADMLNCIVRQESGGRYGGLSNFDKLAGKDNEEFVAKITDTIKQLQQALDILQDMDAMGSLP